ncbi:L-arabinose ABC transporter ATPase [Gammaproteobacteria bacterium]|nr:L-arabinose ABC transporter ATPase [Gammaproteobacteria bacterium]
MNENTQKKQSYLEFKNICKNFPGVKALQDISFACAQGSIHALMGENGAGKSTLLKILSGNYTPTSGNLVIDGEQVFFPNTTAALNAGIAIIYQELHVVPEISVAENIYLGQLPHRFGIVDQKILRANALRSLESLGIDIDPDLPLKSLSIGQWQMVEIAKALTRNARIIAFDEPTSSLSEREIIQLFRVIRSLKEQGKVILYVSHRMEEIFSLSDCITVFKDGKYVKTFTDVKTTTHDILVQAMVGRNLGNIYGYEARDLGAIRFRAKDLLASNMRYPISLEVKQGEIVGLFGLVGAGRSEFLKAIFGGVRIKAGDIYLDDKHLNIKNPIDAINAGIMLCPEDRKTEGIIAIHSVRDNINISARRNMLKSGCLINNDWEKANTANKIKALNIKTPSQHQLMMNLSGGNQQKVILGRWLSEEMKVILLDEPTRGIDVGAKHEIYKVIYDLAKLGICVIFASSDLPEALGLADRIIVMREGLISGELHHHEATESIALSLAMPES